jgi:hypothetical protein
MYVCDVQTGLHSRLLRDFGNVPRGTLIESTDLLQCARLDYCSSVFGVVVIDIHTRSRPLGTLYAHVYRIWLVKETRMNGGVMRMKD